MTGRIGHAMLCAAMILFLPAAHVRAGDDAVPILSADDGSRAWVEISRSGTRTTARPLLEISGTTFRRAKAGGGSRNGRIFPARGESGDADRGRPDLGDLLRRQKSRLVRETPDGVSFGGALDLAGGVREALREGNGGVEKMSGVVELLRDPAVERESSPESFEPEDSFPDSPSGKTAAASARPVHD